jgi:hypothetical protein
MSGFSNSVVGGAQKLIRQAIQSPNFLTGIAGWIVRKDGSAEFNNLTIRGSFFGVNFILNSSGAFFYSGAPAAGNLIISIAPAAGTDGFTNAYKQHITIYGSIPTGGFQRFIQMLATGVPSFRISTGDSSEVNPAVFQSGILNAGAANRQLLTLLSNATVTGNVVSRLQLASEAADASLGSGATLLSGSSAMAIAEATPGGSTSFTVTGQLGNAAANGTIIRNDGTNLITGLPQVPFDPTQVGVTEGWHSLGSPGATNCTVNAGRYRYTNHNECQVDIALTANAGGSTAGTYAWANFLPAQLQFPGAYARSYAMGFNGNVVTATLDANILVDGAGQGVNAGRVRMQIPAEIAGTQFTATIFIPLN